MSEFDRIVTPYDQAMVNSADDIISGRDVTSMIEQNAIRKATPQKPLIQQADMERALKAMQMLDSGDLVPKEIGTQPVTQAAAQPVLTLPQAPQVVQTPPVATQVSAPVFAGSTEATGGFDNWLNALAGTGAQEATATTATTATVTTPAVQQTPTQPVQPVQPVQQPLQQPQIQPQQNEGAGQKPASTGTAILDENLKQIAQAAARRGFGPEQREIAKTIALGLSENDILDLAELRMRKQREAEVKPAPALTLMGNAGYTSGGIPRSHAKPRQFQLAGIGSDKADI